MCVCVLVTHLCLTLWLQPSSFLCPWNSLGKNTGVGSHSLLQGIFPTQESNPGLTHCRQILYCLSHQGSPSNVYYICNKMEKTVLFKDLFYMGHFYTFYCVCYNIASVLCLQVLWSLSSPTRDWAQTSCIRRGSLKHWTTSEAPLIFLTSKIIFHPNPNPWHCLPLAYKGAWLGGLGVTHSISKFLSGKCYNHSYHHDFTDWETGKKNTLLGLSSEKNPTPVPIPSHSWQIIGEWAGFFFKGVGVPSTNYWAFLFLSGIDKLRARTELFQTIERNLCCDREPRQKKGKRRRSQERRLIFREEILGEWRCLKGIAVTFAMWYAISFFFHTFSKKSSVKLYHSIMYSRLELIF